MKQLYLIEGAHDGIIKTVTVSTDSKYIVSGSTDRTIKIWSIQDKKQLPFCFNDTYKDSINSVVFSKDSKYIVSGSNDKTIHIWNVKT